MNWTYIEESEESLERLGDRVQEIADDMDVDMLDTLSMHFTLMKISLVGLRGYEGDMVEDDVIGEKPIVVAQTLQDLGKSIGREGSRTGLTKMFENSYSAVLNMLTVFASTQQGKWEA